MKRFWINLTLVLAFSFVLAGCGGVRYPRYYTLNLPPPPDPTAEQGVRASVAVREFQSPVYLRQGPIVFRSTPQEIGFYEYHRWAADPRKLVTSAVIDHLRASGQYSMVATYSGNHDFDYILSGKLEKLEELDYEGRVKVEVALSAQITRVSTGSTVWNNTVSEIGTVSQRSVSGVVAEMNRAMEVALDKLLSTVPAPLTAKK